MKNEQKDNVYLSKIIEILNRTGLLYNTYFLNCSESEIVSIANSLSDDLKDDNKKQCVFDLIVVDTLRTTSKDVHVSFGTVPEIYEYVVNRAIEPEKKLLADVYTRRRHVSGLLSVRVLSGEKSSILILGEKHNKLDNCDEKADAINADDFFSVSSRKKSTRIHRCVWRICYTNGRRHNPKRTKVRWNIYKSKY